MHRFEGSHIPQADDSGTSHVPERRAQQYFHATGSERCWQSREEFHGLQALQAQDEQRGRDAIEHTEQEMREHATKIADSFIALAREGKTLVGQKVTITGYQHQAILKYINVQKDVGAIDAHILRKVQNMSYGSQEHIKAAIALYDKKKRKK